MTAAPVQDRVTPSPEQDRAIQDIVSWYGEPGRQEFYLAGYAGVGKTTIANIAIQRIKDKYRHCRNVVTGAYTGKAAHRLRQKGAESPSTIHAMIYSVDQVNGKTIFRLNRIGPASDASLIVLDEVSMVNEQIARDIRSFGKKILVMGDPGQLPPVSGAGAFTKRAPDAFLREIHRQAADSPIIRLATAARLGQPIRPGQYGRGVRVAMLDRETQHLVYQSDTQTICGIHRVRWTITARARTRLGHSGRAPLPGERLICCRNDHDLGLFNGMLGVLAASRPHKNPAFLDLDIQVEDEKKPRQNLDCHPYLFGQHFDGPCERPKIDKGITEWDWAYAITCHKAQGSEWPHVTVVDDSGAFRDDRSKWLYTAITRAQVGLTLLLRDAP